MSSSAEGTLTEGSPDMVAGSSAPVELDSPADGPVLDLSHLAFSSPSPLRSPCSASAASSILAPPKDKKE
eukprot:11610049-Alexandrium_andersonii.AAC.1